MAGKKPYQDYRIELTANGHTIAKMQKDTPNDIVACKRLNYEMTAQMNVEYANRANQINSIAQPTRNFLSNFFT